MGYQIPGADFTTSNKLQVNVGAEGLKGLANVAASLGPAYLAHQKETNKLLQIESDYETTTMVANQKIVDQLLVKGEKEIKDPTIYEQWSKEVIARGEAATQAQIDIRFGDLSPEEKKEQLEIVSKFNIYKDRSLTNMGRFTSDVFTSQDPSEMVGNVIIGDLTNGENLLNKITIQSFGKDVADLYGPGATSTRTLNVDGNDNEIHSVVKIPKNGEFFKSMKNQNDAFMDVIKKGIETGNIKEDENGNYVFERNINLNAYEGNGGFDFVVGIGERIDQDQLLKDSNFIDENSNFKPDSFVRTNKSDPESPVLTYQTTENLANNKIGIRSYEILDMAKLNNNEAFKKSVDIEAASILNGKNNQVIAANLANNYKISDIKNWKGKEYKSIQDFLSNASSVDKQSFISESIKQSVYSGMFQGQENSTKAGISLVRKTVDKDFLKYLTENNIMNAEGESYKLGQDVYTRETFDSEKVYTPGVGNIYDKVYKQYADNPTGENAKAIFSTPIKISGGKKDTFHLWVGDGVYIVDADGIKIGDQKEGLKKAGILSALSRGKSKK